MCILTTSVLCTSNPLSSAENCTEGNAITGEWQEGSSNFSAAASNSAREQGVGKAEKFEVKSSPPKPILEPRAVYTSIEDLSDLPLLSADLADRKVAKLRLENKLEMYLISDPKADQSAACVAVGAGSWNDPKEFPGMAHFCEHMLFMGTEKYPDNEFMAKVANYDGLTNAFTAPDRTVYMFSSRTAGFAQLLDRFAHFFIDPLFDVSNISREMHAVDQEFALQKENDGWREYMVFKETGNPEHPNHLFSAGNSKTLSHIPQQALKQWHARHYSAETMRMAIYSSLPIEQLKQMAVTAFQAVPNSGAAIETFDGPLTSDRQKGHILAIEPVKEVKKLSLLWELPAELAEDESLSADLVAFALSRGQKHSLYEKLKSEQLIDSLRIHTENQGGKGHTFFEIEAEISQKGIKAIDRLVERIFQAIDQLKAEGVPEALFREKNKLAQMFYQYQPRIDAFSFISSIGRNLLDEDLATYPRKTILAEGFNPEKVKATLSFLTPDQSILTLLAPAKLLGVQMEQTEQWLKVPYSIESIPSAWTSLWSQAKTHPDIRIAAPNPFVPSNLAVISDPKLGSIPSQFAVSEFGRAYYIRSAEFQTPEAVIHLRILSSLLTPSARSQVLVSLFLDHLTDTLQPTLKAAASAGLLASFSFEKGRIHLEIGGFSDKAPLLLQEILKEMPRNPPTEEQFLLYTARHQTDYANGQKEQAHKQAREILGSLINCDRMTKKEKLAALSEITYADFLAFHKKLFEKTYFETLFSGNLTLKTAESCWLDIVHSLSQQCYPPAEHPQAKALYLAENAEMIALKHPISLMGNATLLLLDEGGFTFERRAAQEILSSALHEAFFETLRTRQKTGYIAQSHDLEFERRLYQTFLVQSNTHQPEDLLHRFELFLEDYIHDLKKNIDESRFKLLKESGIDSLASRYRNLRDKAALWDRLAFDEQGDFDFIKKRIAGLEQLGYEQFCTLAQEYLSRSNRKRLAILVEGKIKAPFAYTQKLASEVRALTHYAPRAPKSGSTDPIVDGNVAKLSEGQEEL